VSAMSNNVGNKTAPCDSAGSRGGGRLTWDRISPQKARGVVDAAHLNDGWMDVGGLSFLLSDQRVVRDLAYGLKTRFVVGSCAVSGGPTSATEAGGARRSARKRVQRVYVCI
jgi:hypothetical protein